jgi:predicted RNA binding protein YcfA (HicA-like mRNA interferase family)
MKVPRNIGGHELAKVLARYGYQVTRQTGRYIRLTTHENGEHHITIPAHQSLRIGTLSAILVEVAEHFDKEKSQLIAELWG